MPVMEFSPEHWKSHDRGQQTRLRILEHLDDNSTATATEIAQNLGCSRRQVERQLSRLKEEGILRYDRKWLITRNNSFFVPKFLRRVMEFLGRPARRRPRGQRYLPIHCQLDRADAEAVYFTLDAVDWMELSFILNFPELKRSERLSANPLLPAEKVQDSPSRVLALAPCHLHYLKKNSPRFKRLCEQMEQIGQGKSIYIAKGSKTRTEKSKARSQDR